MARSELRISPSKRKDLVKRTPLWSPFERARDRWVKCLAEPEYRGRLLRNHELQHSISAGEQDRRDGFHPRNRLLGRVVACSGSRATIAAVAERGTTDLTEL